MKLEDGHKHVMDGCDKLSVVCPIIIPAEATIDWRAYGHALFPCFARTPATASVMFPKIPVKLFAG